MNKQTMRKLKMTEKWSGIEEQKTLLISIYQSY